MQFIFVDSLGRVLVCKSIEASLCDRVENKSKFSFFTIEILGINVFRRKLINSTLKYRRQLG